MRPSFLALSLLVPALLPAQQNWRLDPANTARSHTPLDQGNGDTWYVVDRKFGFDSSYVELMQCDASLAVTNAKAYRLNTPLTFLNQAVQLDDGVLVSGGSTLPFLMLLDDQGDVSWCDGTNNLGFSQTQLLGLFAEGNDFSVYSYPGGTYSDGVYRFDGNAANGFQTGLLVTTDPGTEFRLYTGAKTPTQQIHLMCGAGYTGSQTGEKQVVLTEVTPSGTTWMKYYDLGATAPQIEDPYTIVPLSDGNYLVVGALTTGINQLDGFVMKVDGAGTLQWSRRYAYPGSAVRLSGAIELPNGDLLVSGADQLFNGLLLLLDAGGAVQWAREFLGTNPPAAHILGRIRYDAFNDRYWIHGAEVQLGMTSALANCSFQDVAGITDNPFTPVVTTIPTFNTSAPPDIFALNPQARTPTFSWQVICGPGGVEEGAGTEALKAYPDPTDGPLYLEGEQVRTGMPVVVRDLMGREVLSTRYHGVLDLSGLSPGGYLVELPELQRRVRLVRR
ncbi:MAG: hypothetical protein KDB96_09690 [Flavobacteriales bacterium]|nr:hypothetical protein [Flavobacteriales bacterium]